MARRGRRGRSLAARAAYALLVDGSIWCLILLFNALDVVLRAFSWALPRDPAPPRDGKLPRVVIVGAGFAGAALARELARARDAVDVVLVDRRADFEYAPGALRCLVAPRSYPSIRAKIPGAVRGDVVGVRHASDDGLGNCVFLEDGTQLPYDFLCLCAGADYAAPIKEKSVVEAGDRASSLSAAAEDLRCAKTVAVVGAGAVGVELAAEILAAYPRKRVLLVDMANAILPGFPESAVTYARAWLEERGAERAARVPARFPRGARRPFYTRS